MVMRRGVWEPSYYQGDIKSLSPATNLGANIEFINQTCKPEHTIPTLKDLHCENCKTDKN